MSCLTVSAMPLDVLGRTRATLNRSTCSPFPRGTGKPLNTIRGSDRGLQLFPVKQECLVGASHKLVSITSLLLPIERFSEVLELFGSAANPYICSSHEESLDACLISISGSGSVKHLSDCSQSASGSRLSSNGASTLGPHSLGWPVRFPNAYGAGLFSVALPNPLFET